MLSDAEISKAYTNGALAAINENPNAELPELVHAGSQAIAAAQEQATRKEIAKWLGKMSAEKLIKALQDKSIDGISKVAQLDEIAAELRKEANHD